MKKQAKTEQPIIIKTGSRHRDEALVALARMGTAIAEAFRDSRPVVKLTGNLSMTNLNIGTGTVELGSGCTATNERRIR